MFLLDGKSFGRVVVLPWIRGPGWLHFPTHFFATLLENYLIARGFDRLSSCGKAS